MLKWAEIGDLHLNENDSLGRYDKNVGMNSRLNDKIKLLDEVVQEILEEEVDFVVFLGDIYNSINPSDLLRSLFNSVVRKILDADVKVIIVPGNHETTGQLTAFKDDAVLMGKEVGYYVSEEIFQVEVDGQNIICVPWGWASRLQMVDEETKQRSILFGHFVVEGADFGNIKARGNAGEMISREELEHYKHVALGHIHKKQKFYVGSVFRNTFGELGNPVGYHICQINSKEQVECSYRASHDRPMQQFIVREENGDNSLEKIGNVMEEGGIVKIKFIGSREWVRKLNLWEIRKRYAEKLFSLKLERVVEEISDAVEIKSNKILNFSDVISQLTSDKKLIKYVLSVIEGVK